MDNGKENNRTFSIMKQGCKYYQVADLTLAVDAGCPITENTFNPLINRFEVAAPGNDLVCIHHHFEMPVESDTEKNIYEVYKNHQFRIFKNDRTWIFYYTSVCPGDFVTRVIGIMNEDFSSVNIYSSDLTPEKYRHGNFNALTLFNTDQMLFTRLLCDRKGIMFHANGFNINGNGLLLAGISGAGKSTLSGMLAASSGVDKILCDDRVFVRKRQDEFWLFGNWCYGSHACASPSAVPLKGFLFLEKGVKNQVIEIRDKKKIIPRLLQVMVKPLLTQEGWRQYFVTLEQLLEEVSFYIVDFDLSGAICKQITHYFGDS